MQRYYRPGLREQLQEEDDNGKPCVCRRSNCNMCAAATYLDRVTLGGRMETGCEMRHFSGTFRECTDNNPSNDGTTMEDAAEALSHFGRDLEVVKDGRMSDVFGILERSGVILHGDYGTLPPHLSGDREFDGLHSVFVNEHDRERERSLVYDSLDDGRADLPTGRKAPQGPVWWPDDVLIHYARAFPQSIVYGYEPHPTRIRVNVDRANVRERPHRNADVIVRLDRDDTRDRGSIKTGERIGGDARWWRVWLPGHEKVGYIHASVVRLVG